MHIHCFFFHALWGIHIEKHEKHLLILGKSEKRGGGEKLSDVRKPGVLYSSLFCVFPPVCLPVGGRAYPVWHRCAGQALQAGWWAGMDSSCPGLQQGHWGTPPCPAEVLVMFMEETVGWDLHPLWMAGEPRPAGEGAGGCQPFGQDVRSGLKACWPLDCNWLRSNFGRFWFVQGKIPAELHLISQNL